MYISKLRHQSRDLTSLSIMPKSDGNWQQHHFFNIHLCRQPTNYLICKEILLLLYKNIVFKSRYETLLSAILLFVILYTVVYLWRTLLLILTTYLRKVLFCYDDERVVNYILSIILPSLQKEYFFLSFLWNVCLSRGFYLNLAQCVLVLGDK
jgi:hypothetical protein